MDSLKAIDGEVALGRVFIVGFPRSGTTLAQSMLAAHPVVFSIPETHFFTKIHGRYKWADTRRVSPRAVSSQFRALQQSLTEATGVPSWSKPPPRALVSSTAAGRAFAAQMDRASRVAGKTVWVEKSPAHLHRIGEISDVAPSARFIHVVRHGDAAAASFFVRCKENPGWLKQLSPDGHRHLEDDDDRLVDAIADRWNRDIAITRSYQRSPGHFVLPLESLLASPEERLHEVCAFIGVPYHPQMLEHQRAAPSVIGWRVRYDHMRGPLEPLSTQAPDHRDVLSLDGRRRLMSRLEHGGRWELALGIDRAGSSP